MREPQGTFIFLSKVQLARRHTCSMFNQPIQMPEGVTREPCPAPASLLLLP